MSHVDDGQLNALLDGELTAAEARAVEAHVASCRDCARRLSEARAFLAEAGELLAVLTPPAAEPVAPLAAAAPPPVAAGPAPADPPRPGDAPRIAKTAKEVAISVDGRTELTPAIRPVFPHEVPPGRRRWPLPDVGKLAWAASLILAVGVGYLTNEVYHQRSVPSQLARADRLESADSVATPTNSAADELALSRRTAAPPAAPAVAAAPFRRSAGPAAGSGSRRADPQQVAAEPPKPQGGKTEGDSARTAGDQLAAGALADTRQRNDVAQPAAPVPAEREGREQNRTNALEEVAVTAAPPPSQPAAARLRSAPASAPAAARDAAGFAAPGAGAFSTVRLEEAVRRLSGSVRLIDGMNPGRVEVGPGRLVAGANPEREVIRISYPGGLVLDQQLGDADAASFNGLMAGDTLVTTGEAGTTQVRWLDRKFWLSLTGRAPADSLRALVERVR